MNSQSFFQLTDKRGLIFMWFTCEWDVYKNKSISIYE